MFKIIQNGKNRLDIELSGKIETEEMKTALDELESKSENIENGKMLYEIIDFHLPSLLSGEVLGQDTQREIVDIGRQHGFHVLTDGLSVMFRTPGPTFTLE